MKKFSRVFNFEFNSIIRHNSYLIATLVITVLVFALSFLPRFMPSIFNNTNRGANKNATVDINALTFKNTCIYSSNSEIDVEYLKTIMGLESKDVLTSESDVKKAVESGEYNIGFVVETPTKFNSYIKNKEFMDDHSERFTRALEKYNYDKSLINNGVDPGIIEKNSKAKIDFTEKVLNKDRSHSFVFSIVFVILFDLMILFYGSVMSNNISREKKDKTIEVLLSSAKPSVFVFGKLLSSAVLGLIQYFIFIFAGIIGIFFNKNYYPEGIWTFFTNTLSLKFLLTILLFVVFGFVLYLILFQILGLAVKRAEEVNFLIVPIFLVLVGLFIVIINSLGKDSDILIKILSFVPFSSATLMPVRFLLNDVKLLEIGISFGLMLIVIVLLLIRAIKMYRKSAMENID
ncbi:ABC transporter permease [Finegoldia magna]|uniref:Antibiotic ABC transporter permease protein n=1 Tax=Finegoldia magna (strain ATCC 29328 / DSM 20472 / WAL 2508) TaxID=334413 RepID=B0S2I7_FINM2|nr:ABC transporter permease [Finegoldia magna]UEA70077.1 ABC transporter permease [Finegoldia magna]BAG08577.1 antibiotic ABC transporter permease protein [Finegoldia magna ATCC 29328]